LKITEEVKHFGLAYFLPRKKLCSNFDKNGFTGFWATFSQTHLDTWIWLMWFRTAWTKIKKARMNFWYLLSRFIRHFGLSSSSKRMQKSRIFHKSRVL
jgi:hypothetical protein